MRCTNCQYLLWNLKGRQCPECGTPFRPGDFQFIANSVRFCCPDCEQAYYGTSTDGHLEPPAFDCVSCGRHLDMNEMVLRPAAGVRERQATSTRMPWLERKQQGWWRSWLSTIGMSMTVPHRLIDVVPVDSRPAQSWWFATLSWGAFLLCGMGIPLVILGLVALASGDNDGFGVIAVGVCGTAGVTALILLYTLLWGLTVQGMLRITGRQRRSLGRTYAALCFSAGAGVLCAVPCVGLYCMSWMAGIWWIVSAILMVAVGHGVHGGRAALAVLPLPVTTVILGIVGYLGFSFWAMTGPMAAATAAMSQSEIRPIVSAVQTHANANDGAGPRHGLQLISDGQLDPMAFISWQTETLLEDVPVGSLTLEDVYAMGPEEQAEAIREFVETVPEQLVAHRVGDFVFTYHGIDLTADDPLLWTVILWPDHAADPAEAGPEVCFVGRVDGFVETIAPASFEDALVTQNARREEAGLPPLPAPDDVRHGEPALPP